MNRDTSLHALQSGERWDVLVIGGGASGLGAAVDAAARGYRTALVEQHDFAKGTSSRSTKLVHGGVRYLRQGNISLVRESLRERTLLLRNAPHLTRRQSFVIPAYRSFERLFYGTGLKAYDALAGKYTLGPSRLLSRGAVLDALPGVSADGLRGGVEYFDGQFDDAAVALALAKTLHHLGGFAANYVRVESFLKENGRATGVMARDLERAVQFPIQARAIINATGVFADSVRRLDDERARGVIALSQGAHIVVNQSFLPGRSALMVPKTADGRVMFAIPWQGHVVIGTTDTAVSEATLEPRPLAQEVEFILEHAARYLAKVPRREDILSVFAGLRPLVKAGATENTARLARDHSILVSESGVVTIVGGKWTTYRHMAEKVVKRAAAVAGLPTREPRTEQLRLRDETLPSTSIVEVTREAARREMVRTVEDVLARRSRLLFLNARAALEAAPEVARTLAAELQRDEEWIAAQLEAFRAVALRYCWP